MKIDFSNVQGMVFDHPHYPLSRHLIFHFGDRDGGRAFLRGLIPLVTFGDQPSGDKPDSFLNFGLTFGGLQALGVDPAILAKFDAMFKAGPSADALGDVAGSPSDPRNWWEGQFTTDQVHCIVHLYYLPNTPIEEKTAELQALAGQSNVTELMPRSKETSQGSRRLDGQSLPSGRGKLHFGYTDGISHPDICWDDDATDPAKNPQQINFRNFLLGYSSPVAFSAPGTGPAADLVRDSSYAVFRWLYQDVAGFNRFLASQAGNLAPDLPVAEAQELLAAKMMGRWRDGTPLVLSPDKADPALASSNDFMYQATDPNGLKCPLSAHIRVVNPRDQKLMPAVGKVPHIIRRGMPYGPEINPLDAVDDDGEDRGLVGIFLCSDIRLQFYTLTGWIKQNDFSPAFSNTRLQDALFANRQLKGAVTDFIIPTQTGAVTLKSLPDFIHTKGTALLLLPSLSTLNALSAPM